MKEKIKEKQGADGGRKKGMCEVNEIKWQEKEDIEILSNNLDRALLLIPINNTKMIGNGML